MTRWQEGITTLKINQEWVKIKCFNKTCKNKSSQFLKHIRKTDSPWIFFQFKKKYDWVWNNFENKHKTINALTIWHQHGITMLYVSLEIIFFFPFQSLTVIFHDFKMNLTICKRKKYHPITIIVTKSTITLFKNDVTILPTEMRKLQSDWLAQDQSDLTKHNFQWVVVKSLSAL